MATARARTFLAHGWRSLAAVGTFVASAAVGVSLHGDLAATRRLAARITNDALGDLFEGKLVVENVESLSIRPTAHARIDRVTVFDPEGRKVISARGITADISLTRLLGSVVFGAPAAVRIGDARIDDADVVLDRDPDGTIGLARAFHPRPVPPKTPLPTAPPPELTSKEDVILRIDRAFVRHAWVHGNVAPPALDGDAWDVRTRLAVERNVFSLDVEGGKTTLRSPRAPTQIGDVHGDVTGHLTVPLETAALTGDADLRGDVGGLPFIAHAGIIDDTVIAASLDVARVEPAVVERTFPSVTITQPVELHAKADGKLPAIALHVIAKSAAAEAKADGEIDLREGNAFKLDVDAAHFDTALVGGPKSDLSARAHAEGHLTPAPSGTFNVTGAEGSIAGEHVPAVVAEGRLEDRKVTSTFRASEPGIDASGKVVLDVGKDDVAFDVQARSYDLAKLARAPRVASGAASVRVAGTVDVARRTIHARATANGDALASGQVRVRRAHAEADVSGPLLAPVLDVTATGTDVRLATPGKDPLVYPKAVARARVTLVPAPRVTNAEVNIGEPGAKDAVALRAESIDFGSGGVVVRGGRVEGLGAPLEADVDLSGPRWTIRAKGDDVDLERAAAVTGISQLRLLPAGARATVDIDVSSDGSGARGHADLTVRAGAGASADVHAAFTGRHVSGHARGELAGLGFVEVPSAELDLDGPPTAGAFARATGFADVRGSIDLAQVGVPSDAIEQLNGRAIVEGRIERGDPHALPAVRATVSTRELEIAVAGRKIPIRGVEAAAHAAWDGRTGDAELSFFTWDAHGVLASGNAKARLPAGALIEGKRKHFLDAVGAASLSGIVDVPARSFEDTPDFLLPRGFSGTIAARAELSGMLAAPQLSFVGRTLAFREKGNRGGRERYEPIDAVVEGRWDGRDLVAVMSADERDGGRNRDRGSGRVRAMLVGRVSAKDLFALRDGKDPRFTADAEIEVEDLELSPIPLKTRIRGALTGRATLRDLGGAPSLSGRAHVDQFAVSGARVDALDFDIGARDGSLYASARAIDGGNRVLDVSVASRAFRWKGVAPGWSGEELTRVDYRAAGLRLALLRSFARNAIADLDGRIDGSGSAMFDAKTQTFDGQLALSGGRLYVNTLGDHVTDVNAVARFEPNGIFRIQDATGKVEQGEFRASATGRMRGLTFIGANATVVVPSKNGIPLSSEGVSFADATGEVRLEARMSDDRKALLVTIDVPRAEIELPRRATPNLQPLEPDETILTGVRSKNGKLDAIALDQRRRRGGGVGTDEPAEESATHFTVSLGDEVFLEGNGLRIQLSGKTLVQIADEVRVTGRINLKRGTIAAHGRSFTVEEGSVTFLEGGDAANPLIVAAAYWDAPDRTRIWVEFKGPLKTGKLTLRSEPAFSKNEIFSILLFGRPDPNMAVQGQKPGEGSQATAVATGFAAADVSRALAQLDENLQVETDTLSGNRTRTKVGYRLARNLRVQVGYAPGRATYREPDTTFAFLDWQFLPKLSLIATQGNRGTSILDVLFQHRY